MSREDYISLVVREFRRLKDLADGAITQLPTEELFAFPGETDNSVATIVKHVSGNMRSRWLNFLTTDGEKPDRERETEFQITKNDTRETLLARWAEAWGILFAELKALGLADLERTVTIRGEALTVLQAINRQLTHYAYHVGQIVYVAKHHRGGNWKSLSIPPGASKAFNASPARYIEKI